MTSALTSTLTSTLTSIWTSISTIFFLPFIILLLLFSSCSIYQTHFEKGGELTSDFLERIEERPQGEDILLPPKSKEETP